MDRPRQFHAVRFYENADDLSAIVAGFLCEGFARAQPAIVIATPQHREQIERQLAGRGVPSEHVQRDGRLVMLDAQATLDQFMVDGMPNAVRFRQTIVPVIEKASGGSADRVVRAYGEMVDVLWKSSQTVAATRLETLWNALGKMHNFSLLCGYAMGSFYKSGAVDEICSHHSHVVTDSGDAAIIN